MNKLQAIVKVYNCTALHQTLFQFPANKELKQIQCDVKGVHVFNEMEIESGSVMFNPNTSSIP